MVVFYFQTLSKQCTTVISLTNCQKHDGFLCWFNHACKKTKQCKSTQTSVKTTTVRQKNHKQPVVFKAFKTIYVKDSNLHFWIQILPNWFVNIINKPTKYQFKITLWASHHNIIKMVKTMKLRHASQISGRIKSLLERHGQLQQQNSQVL